MSIGEQNLWSDVVFGRLTRVAMGRCIGVIRPGEPGTSNKGAIEEGMVWETF